MIRITVPIFKKRPSNSSSASVGSSCNAVRITCGVCSKALLPFVGSGSAAQAACCANSVEGMDSVPLAKARAREIANLGGAVGQMARENDLFTMIHGGFLPLVDGLALILRTYLASFPSSKATKSWNTGVPATWWWSMQSWPHVTLGYPLLFMVSPESRQLCCWYRLASGPFSGLQAAWTIFIGDPKKKSKAYTQEPINTSHFRKFKQAFFFFL